MTIARLAYELSGDDTSPVLVMGCSLGTTMAMWDPQVEAMRAHFRVLRFDHRGHGGSEVPQGPYTMHELGRDLITLLDRLGISRPSYCGLSLGAMMGMLLAAEVPERIDRLALCCASAKLGTAEMWSERAARVRAHGTASEVDASLGRWFTPAFRRHEAATVERAADWLRATPAEGYAACCEAIQAMDLRADLPRISAPTLVVAAAHDPSTPPAHARAIAAGIPAASLRVVDGAAHLANIEQPQVVTQLLLDHLAA